MSTSDDYHHLLPILSLHPQLFLQDHHLQSLLSNQHPLPSSSSFPLTPILNITSHHNFSTHTSFLSINYLHRFLSHYQFPQSQSHPWLIHLLSLACVSIAAKFEEVHVPLFPQLREDLPEFVFAPKSIRKMELMILSALDWRMNSLTPVSFVNLVVPCFGLRLDHQSEFLRRSEEILVSVLPDSRFQSYLPSILGTATMLHVIDQIHISNPIPYHTKIISMLNINKEEVMDCYELLREASTKQLWKKRERDEEIPSSPSGVIDSCYIGLENSNDSWSGGSSNSSSVSSSPNQQGVVKRNKRVHEQSMPLRVFVNAIGSP